MYLFSCGSELVFNSAGKLLLLLRGEWKPHLVGEPRPALRLAHLSRILGFSDNCTLPPLRRTVVPAILLLIPSGQRTMYQPPQEHVSMCNMTWESHFYYTSNCKVDLTGSCVKAVNEEKHKINSPHWGCSVTHRDKGRVSHYEGCCLCSHVT